MNVFRLVLCLAGLAAYLVTKQPTPSSEANSLAPTVQGSANSNAKAHEGQGSCSKRARIADAGESADASRQTSGAKQ